jgi:transcription elongation factor Elf1
MGIRCLLGHDFGGREVERDRREDGDEVVVAYRTVETCERCGSRRVVSENKEIKPLKSAVEAREAAETTLSPEAGGATAEESSPASGAAASESAPGPQGEVRSTTDEEQTPADPDPVAASTVEDAAIIIDDAPAGERDDAADAESASDPSDAAERSSPAPDLDAVVESEPDTELLDDGQSGDETDDDETAVVDDGQTELLDGETDDVDDEAAVDDSAAWPDAPDDAGDEFDAESPTAGGPTVTVDDGDGSPAPWPEEERVERDSNGTKFVRPEAETPDRDSTTEFHCPNCGSAHAAAASSLRSGDVCPDCRKGYLAERQVEADGRNA